MTDHDPDLAHLSPRERRLRMDRRRQEQARKDAPDFGSWTTPTDLKVDLEALEAAKKAEAFAMAVESARAYLPAFSRRCPGGMSYALNEPDGPVRLQFNSDDPIGRWRIMEVMTLEEAVRRQVFR